MATGVSQAGLVPLMALGPGSPGVRVAVLDGPVHLLHPGLQRASLHAIGRTRPLNCGDRHSVACRHGTFVLGVLASTRGLGTPAICPGCTFGIRPVFADAADDGGATPSASAADLAEAIDDSVAWGARVMNISASVARSSPRADRILADALDRAAGRGVLVVAAAGNEGGLRGSVITGHPGVIPVAAVDAEGRPLASTNLGLSIGGHGLAAPGEDITSLDTVGTTRPGSGTSVAAPFVTGAIALLMSAFPWVPSAQIRSALRHRADRRASLMPPLLDAAQAFKSLADFQGRTHHRFER